jgi:hypothetical protein
MAKITDIDDYHSQKRVSVDTCRLYLCRIQLRGCIASLRSVDLCVNCKSDEYASACVYTQ